MNQLQKAYVHNRCINLKAPSLKVFFCSDLPWVELKILGFFWNHVSSVYKIKEFELLSLSFDKSQYDRQLHSLNSGIRNVMATNTDLHTFLNLKPGRSFTFMDQVNFVDPRWYKFRRFLRKYCPMRSISFYYIIMDQKRFFNRSQMFFSFFPKRKSATHTLPLPNTPSPLSSINYLLCTPYPPFHILTHFPVLLSQG